MKLAADWGQWASDCEARATRPAEQQQPVVTITATMSTDRTVWAERLDVATGQALHADVIPFRR